MDGSGGEMRHPEMARLLARILGVVCVGLGVGLLAWGISSGALREPISEQAVALAIFPSASAVIGWGAGILAAGVTTLFLTVMDRPYGPWEE